MIIKTFDPQTLQEKETISKLTSVIWNDRFYKVGSFEIQTTSNKFKKEGVAVTLTVTPCWCYGSETMDMDTLPRNRKKTPSRASFTVFW